METHFYTSLWNKYRPVVLKLMTDAALQPQEYKLFAHEFKAMGEKVKSGYSFLLEASNGKAKNNIKDSAVARDLLLILQQSNKAMELMRDATYELSMDKNFMLRVNRKSVEAVIQD